MKKTTYHNYIYDPSYDELDVETSPLENFTIGKIYTIEDGMGIYIHVVNDKGLKISFYFDEIDNHFKPLKDIRDEKLNQILGN